jgi:hypothetical protein
MYIYAFSDIYGRLEAFNKSLDLINLEGDNILVLLGNFIGEGNDNSAVLDKIIALEKQYGTDKIIVTLGGKEAAAIDGESGFYDNHTYMNWLKMHNYYHIVDNSIFYNMDVFERVKKEREDNSKTPIDIIVVSQKNFKEELTEFELITEEESKDFILPNIIGEDYKRYIINSTSGPCERLTILAKEFGEKYEICEYLENGRKYGVDDLRALYHHFQENKIWYAQKVRYGKYKRSVDYFEVTEETEQELLPLAENIFGETPFAEHSFEANQKLTAIIRLNYLLIKGADEKLLTDFEAGKLNCVYPKGDKATDNNERYKKAVDVFKNLYKSKNNKKPLVYLCIPSGNILNLLYVGTDEERFGFPKVSIYKEVYYIKSFVFNNTESIYDLTGNEKLSDLGDFCEITYKINKNGLIYRVIQQ